MTPFFHFFSFAVIANHYRKYEKNQERELKKQRALDRAEYLRKQIIADFPCTQQKIEIMQTQFTKISLEAGGMQDYACDYMTAKNILKEQMPIKKFSMPYLNMLGFSFELLLKAKIILIGNFDLEKLGNKQYGHNLNSLFKLYCSESKTNMSDDDNKFLNSFNKLYQCHFFRYFDSADLISCWPEEIVRACEYIDKKTEEYMKDVVREFEKRHWPYRTTSV